jgi:hypothetical protein
LGIVKAWTNIAVFLLLGVQFAHTEEPTFIFPEEVYELDDLAFANDAIYALLTHGFTLFKLDRSTGSVLERHTGKGKGPGEWVRPRHVLVFEDRVYVSDYPELDISVFSLDLEHIKDVKLDVRILSPVVNSRGLFSATHNRATQNIMVHFPKLGDDSIEFGISAPVHQENQWGYLAQKGDRLYHLSGVYFRISVFDFDRNLLEEIEPPFELKDFFEGCDLSPRNFAKNCDDAVAVQDIFVDGSDHLYVYLLPRKTRRYVLYRYNLITQKWSAAAVSNLISDGNQLYESYRLEDDRIAIKPLNVTFRTYGER